MITFHRKLFISLTTIFVVSFILLGFFMSTSMTDRINRSEEKRLKVQAEQFLSLAENDPDALDHFNKLMIFSNERILIQKDGNTYYQSNPKIKADIQKKMQIWNDSETRNRLYHYFPEDEETLYVYNDGKYKIHIIDEMTDIKAMQHKIWKFLSFTLLTELPILYIIVRYINRSYVEPIREVTYASRLLAEGNYKVRVPESSVTETKDLYISTNILARTLQALNNEQKLQRNRLETILKNIPSAIMLVNHHGEVVIANHTYQALFNKGYPIHAGHFEDIIAYDSIKDMIKQAMVTEKAINDTIQIQIKVHNKYFDAAVVPVLSATRKKLEGVVIVLHDITQLKTLEQMRKDFVANVSHELKTPITSIKGFSETLLDGAKNEPELLEQFLNIILKESNRIQVLVSELLELSKIEQNSELQLTRVNASEKVLNCVDVVHQLAEKKHIEIKLDVDAQMFVAAEPSKLKQVIINLLSNAINYSPEGARIDVRLYPKDQNCVLEIEDQGIGMEEKELARIFERFYRVDKARSRDSGGTGLGLAIVKHIVEVFNGHIEVESEPGKGSIFRVFFKRM